MRFDNSMSLLSLADCSTKSLSFHIPSYEKLGNMRLDLRRKI